MQKGPIRVMHLIHSDGLYGADRGLMAIMKYSDRSRVKNILASFHYGKGKNVLLEEVSSMGISTHKIFASGAYDPMMVFRLCRLLKKEDIDILHTHGHKPDVVGLLTKLFARKIILVATLHGAQGISFKMKLYEFLRIFSLKFYDAVITVSDRLTKEISKKVNKEKITEITNGLDIEEVDTVIQQYGSGKERSSKETFTIGYIGRLYPGKRVEDLIQAIPIISQKVEKGTKIKLVIVGDGPYRNELEKLTEELGLSQQVDFTGYRSDSTRLLLGFNIMVLLSISEGISRVLMEALAAGKPVVASDIEGNRKLVNNYKTGLLVELRNPGKVAEAVLFLINNSDRAKEMGECGRKLVESKFSAIFLSKEHDKLYLEIYKKKRAGEKRNVSLA